MIRIEYVKVHGIGVRWVLASFILGPVLPRYGYSKQRSSSRFVILPYILIFPDPILSKIDTFYPYRGE